MEMNKGFILTISALYYAALFILFLSLVIVMPARTTNFGSETTANQTNNASFIQGNASVGVTSTDYWCSIHISNYDANLNLGSQSPITYKNYCENYDGKRII